MCFWLTKRKYDLVNNCRAVRKNVIRRKPPVFGYFWDDFKDGPLSGTTAYKSRGTFNGLQPFCYLAKRILTIVKNTFTVVKF